MVNYVDCFKTFSIPIKTDDATRDMLLAELIGNFYSKMIHCRKDIDWA